MVSDLISKFWTGVVGGRWSDRLTKDSFTKGGVSVALSACVDVSSSHIRSGADTSGRGDSLARRIVCLLTWPSGPHHSLDTWESGLIVLIYRL
jgi:hypothetical protein